jgi:type I restriction enzyme, R subunit
LRASSLHPARCFKRKAPHSGNDHFADESWEDAVRVQQLIIEVIPARVAEDPAYQTAQQDSDKQNANRGYDKALARAMKAIIKDDTKLFKLFLDNDGFKGWITDTVFGMTCTNRGA